MPFEKGQSGNPKGRPKDKPFSDMLRIAIKEASAEGGTKLRAVADVLVNEAIKGNVQAIKELADRLDGKPAQALEHSGAIESTISKEQRDAAVAAATRANG